MRSTPCIRSLPRIVGVLASSTLNGSYPSLSSFGMAREAGRACYSIGYTLGEKPRINLLCLDHSQLIGCHFDHCPLPPYLHRKALGRLPSRSHRLLDEKKVDDVLLHCYCETLRQRVRA